MSDQYLDNEDLSIEDEDRYTEQLEHQLRRAMRALNDAVSLLNRPEHYSARWRNQASNVSAAVRSLQSVYCQYCGQFFATVAQAEEHWRVHRGLCHPKKHSPTPRRSS